MHPDVSEPGLGIWDLYTPVLQGSGGNPTLGTGSEQYGHYFILGDVVFVSARVQIGGAGFVNGTGTVFISLPVPAEPGYFATIMTIGAGWFKDTSGDDSYLLTAILGTGDANELQVQFRPQSTATSVLTYTTPVTWAASDDIAFSGFYKAA